MTVRAVPGRKHARSAGGPAKRTLKRSPGWQRHALFVNTQATGISWSALQQTSRCPRPIDTRRGRPDSQVLPLAIGGIMLIAIAGGLGGAVCFAVAALCASSSSRQIGAASTLAWVMALGLCVLVVPLALAGHPSRLSGGTVALLCIAGLSNVVGLLLEYVAFRHVAVGIVSAIASTEGMFAAVLSSLFGAPLATSTIVLLVVITFGVVLAAAHLDPPGDKATTPQAKDGLRSSSARAMGRLNGTLTRSALFVVPVAFLFGITLYATGRAGTQAPVIWAILPARLFGTILITSPLLLRRELKISRRTFPLVLSGGVAEVVGLASYTFGARHQLAVAAVLASQCAAITPIAAFFLFGDRLRPHQVFGVALVVAGVVTLSALRS